MAQVDLILVACLLSNCFMFGVICFVQLVQYPQFGSVRVDDWTQHHLFHSNRTGFVVGMPMLVQIIATLAVEPRSVLLYLFTFLSIGVTALVSMPLHRRLAKAHDSKAIQRLIVSNWLRVVGWGGATALLSARVLGL
jgi:hypothetical protein